ncbi:MULTISPECIES: hypothetical protein [unclassified Cupriavidus]|uniref:hypothetical protein n=1 Tax=unclassified Cupriavidus TaxID=2640874 RepID=UPI00313E5320
MSENAFVQRDAFHMLCDQVIGRGISRVVYSSKVLPDCVVKVEDGAGSFQNVIEWETWQRVSDTPFSRWFAACRWISPSGSVLVMERTRPATPSEFPEKMPVFLTDFKRTNYGVSMMADPKTGQPAETFVCHDYGTSLLFEHGMSKRLRKAEWWDV